MARHIPMYRYGEFTPAARQWRLVSEELLSEELISDDLASSGTASSRLPHGGGHRDLLMGKAEDLCILLI